MVDAVGNREVLGVILAREAGDELQMRRTLEEHERRDGLAWLALAPILAERQI